MTDFKDNTISVGSSLNLLRPLWRLLSDLAYMSRPGRFLYPVIARYSDSLQAGRSGDRIPVERRGGGRDFPHPSRPDQPAFYTMGTGSFLGVKRSGCGVDHPSPSSAEVKERVEVYLYSLSGSSWPVLG